MNVLKRIWHLWKSGHFPFDYDRNGLSFSCKVCAERDVFDKYLKDTHITLDVMGCNIVGFDTIILKIPPNTQTDQDMEDLHAQLIEKFPDKSILIFPDNIEVKLYKKEVI